MWYPSRSVCRICIYFLKLRICSILEIGNEDLIYWAKLSFPNTQSVPITEGILKHYRESIIELEMMGSFPIMPHQTLKNPETSSDSSKANVQLNFASFLGEVNLWL